MKVSLSTEPAGDSVIDYVKQVENFADFMHCDVMDGIFVNNVRFSVEKLKNINSVSTIPLDVHLMVANPKKHIKNYADNGANIITVHYESYNNYKDIIKDIKLIKKLGCLAGVSVNPDTFIDKIVPLLEMVDLVLIMSVVPGKSGQSFIVETYDKLKTLNKYRKYNNYKFLVEVDGGVNAEISQKLKDFDVDMVVSGNYVFKSENKHLAINSLK